MKILWVSRHEPLPSQIVELQRLFGGDVEVIQSPRQFFSAGDIKNQYVKSEASELVLVAPLSVIKEVLAIGIKPLAAKMIRTRSGEGDVAVLRKSFSKARQVGSKYHYKFVKFHRIVDIRITYEEL